MNASISVSSYRWKLHYLCRRMNFHFIEFLLIINEPFRNLNKKWCLRVSILLKWREIDEEDGRRIRRAGMNSGRTERNWKHGKMLSGEMLLFSSLYSLDMQSTPFNIDVKICQHAGGEKVCHVIEAMKTENKKRDNFNANFMAFLDTHREIGGDNINSSLLAIFPHKSLVIS